MTVTPFDRLKVTTPAALLKKLNSFPWAEWDKSLGDELAQPYRDLVVATSKSAAAKLGAQLDANDPLLQKFMTGYVLERAKQLNATTKASVADIIRSSLEAGDPKDLSTKVLDKVRETFEGYQAWRAERIARTESAIAYSHANILGYSQAGVSEVDVEDGTEDEICEEANGQTWSLKEALANPVGHPNCVRGFLPVVPEGEANSRPNRLTTLALDTYLPYICAVAAERITALDDPCSTRALDDITDED